MCLKTQKARKITNPAGFQKYSSSTEIFLRIHFLSSLFPTARLSIVCSRGMDIYQDRLRLFLEWCCLQAGLVHLLSAWFQLRSLGFLLFFTADKLSMILFIFLLRLFCFVRWLLISLGHPLNLLFFILASGFMLGHSQFTFKTRSHLDLLWSF